MCIYSPILDYFVAYIDINSNSSLGSQKKVYTLATLVFSERFASIIIVKACTMHNKHDHHYITEFVP